MIWKNLDILLLLNNTVKRSMTIVYKSLQTADTDDKNMAVPFKMQDIVCFLHILKLNVSHISFSLNVWNTVFLFESETQNSNA